MAYHIMEVLMALSLDLARAKALSDVLQSYEENPAQGFDNFLEWCVDVEY